ncbi:MAG TPA: potassium channel family protein [Xanthomonadales bacterium]|nr:potassium channel family protein [Xanthomonadales bacterium]
MTVHAVGLAGANHWLRRRGVNVDPRFWPPIWILICIATWIILLHLVQIGFWAAFYTWQHGMPDFQSAFYFSAVTYTTTGYGDLVLPAEWRLVGGIEALTGILMCGLSTGCFFAVLIKLFGVRTQ